MVNDKSIRDTAIITFTLIGGLFLLQKCSGDNVKIENKLYIQSGNNHSVNIGDKEEVNSSNDSSYKGRDSQINLASYKSTSDAKKDSIIETKEVNKDKSDKNDSSFTHSITVEKNGSIPILK